MTKKKKQIFCSRCKGEIFRNIDRWVNLRDFDRGEITEEGNVHLQCWQHQYKEKIQYALSEKVKQIFPIIQKMMGGGQTHVEIK